MSTAPDVAFQLATIAIAAAGLLLLIPAKRNFAFRLLISGSLIAAARVTIPIACPSDSTTARVEEAVAWLGVFGTIAAIFGFGRIAVYFIVPAAAVWLAVPLVWPILEFVGDALTRNWWIVAILMLAPLLAALVVAVALNGLRARVHASHSTHFIHRAFARLLDRLSGQRRRLWRRDRHIGGAAHPGLKRNGARR